MTNSDGNGTMQQRHLDGLRDKAGRVIKLRNLSALDTLRLLKVAGPQLAQNQPWLSIATLAYAVTEIDGIPVPVPMTEAQIEAVVERLGEDTLGLIADALDPVSGQSPTEMIASAGN